MGGSDPEDAAADLTYVINTLPPATQGTVFLGDPTVPGNAISVGQELTPTELEQLQFVATDDFTGTTFTYSAKDTVGAIDATPGTVFLTPGLNIPPDTTDKTVLVNPDQTPDAGDPPNIVAPIVDDGDDPDGTVENYRIESLPDATDGVLYFDENNNGTLEDSERLNVGSLVPADQADRVRFQAAETFDGAEFDYASVDDRGVPDTTPGTVTLQAPPNTTNGQQVVAKGEAVPLTNLTAALGSDPDGTVVRFRVTSLGDIAATDGKLYLGSVSPANEVTVGQEIEAGDIDSLIFVAEDGFDGASFEFAAIDNNGNPDATPATFRLLTPPETNDAVGTLDDNEVIQLSTAAGTGSAAMTTQLAAGSDTDGTVDSYRIDVATITEGELFLGDPAGAGVNVTTLAGFDATSNTVTIAAADLPNLFFRADGDFAGNVAIEYVAIDNDDLADPTPGTIYLNEPGASVPPNTLDATEDIPQGTTVAIPGLGGSDPDGNVQEFVITDLSDIAATDGKLFYGDPTDGTGTAIEIVPFDPATPGSGTRIPLADIDKIFFQAENGFDGATFQYAAIDNTDTIDPTPATVTLTTPPDTTGSEQSILPDTTNLLNQFPAVPGVDPDGGDIDRYRITSLPDTADGKLYIGNPDVTGSGAIEVAAGTDLTPAQLANLYFDAEPGFNGGSFEYAAIDNEDSIDPTPAVYALNGPPETNEASGRVNPGNAIELVDAVAMDTVLSDGTDLDGTVTQYRIDLSSFDAAQGQLYIGDPATGGTPIDATNNTIAAADLSQLYFDASGTFTGVDIEYVAIDNDNLEDPTPGTISLVPATGNLPPDSNDATALVESNDSDSGFVTKRLIDNSNAPLMGGSEIGRAHV